MNEGSSFSIFSLILNANFIVQLIMLTLVCMSIYSWKIIFEINSKINKYEKEKNNFDKLFWSGQHIKKLYNYYINQKDDLIGKSEIFIQGIKEYFNLIDIPSLSGNTVLDGMERKIGTAIGQEAKTIERKLPIIGVIGAISPYIGLVGTVWGIMSSFNTLGGVEQATISVVAPHIAEALIATALGLFVAIPAVIAHSKLSHNIDSIISDYETFQDDLRILLLREAHTCTSSKENHDYPQQDESQQYLNS